MSPTHRWSPRPALARLGVGLGLGLTACRPVPATIEAGAPTTSAEPTVFVEDPSGAQAVAPAPSGALIAAAYVDLYACWFERPYSYMFSSAAPTLDIDGASYGMLMAGIDGILYYGHLNECAGRVNGVKPRSYSDIAPLEQLAGVPAALPNPALPFDSVNPEFVAWARASLLPPADQLIAGLPAQLGYDRVFRRFFRTMAWSLLWLLDGHALGQEGRSYLRDVTAGADGIDWLERRYASIPITDAHADGTSMTGPMAVGFWLRRDLDGTIDSCWHTLVDVLARYDRDWLDALHRQYPAGAAILDQLPDPATSEIRGPR